MRVHAGFYQPWLVLTLWHLQLGVVLQQCAVAAVQESLIDKSWVGYSSWWKDSACCLHVDMHRVLTSGEQAAF